MRQLTFRIALPDAGKYRVILLASDGEGSPEVELATTEIDHPFALSATLPPAPKGSSWPTPDELTALLGDPHPPANELVIPNAGRALGAVLESGALGPAWRNELKAAWQKKGKPVAPVLRIVLDIRPPELRALPWELAVPSSGADPVARRQWVTVSRWHDAVLPAAAMSKLTEPLRFLIVVGCKENENVQWREELHHLLALTAPRLHAVDFELFITHRIRNGQLVGQLRDTLEEFEPHVVHFIGHGEARTDQSEAALVLHDVTDPDPKRHLGRMWSCSDIVNALSPAPPRLVVLNACRSASFAGSDGVMGIAESLLDNGVAAVVGMQGDIPVASAAQFASGFYELLLRGSPIDEAMVVGRHRIGGVSTAAERDWAMPSLITGVAIDQILPLATVDDSDAGLRVRAFVDRRTQRRALRARAEAATQAGNAGLLLVRGESEMGKSTLVQYALEGCSLRGRMVRYVSFKDLPSLNIVDVLRHIRGPRLDPANVKLIERTLYSRFASFNDALTALLQGRMPADSAGAGEDFPELPYDESRAHPRTIELALDAFKRCLRDTTSKAPLVIALDEIGKPAHGQGISVEYFTGGELTLSRALLAPIAERKAGVIGDVCCVVCASTDDEKAYKLAEISPAIVPCDVDLLRSEDFDLLAREYLLQTFRTRNLTHADMVDFVDSLRPIFSRQPHFKPKRLQLVEQGVRDGLP